jgi:hypothetical protein
MNFDPPASQENNHTNQLLQNDETMHPCWIKDENL